MWEIIFFILVPRVRQCTIYIHTSATLYTFTYHGSHFLCYTSRIFQWWNSHNFQYTSSIVSLHHLLHTHTYTRRMPHCTEHTADCSQQVEESRGHWRIGSLSESKVSYTTSMKHVLHKLYSIQVYIHVYTFVLVIFYWACSKLDIYTRWLVLLGC